MDLLRRSVMGPTCRSCTCVASTTTLVVAGDTFFADPDQLSPPPDGGPFPAPGRLRGPGGPAYLDPVSAVELARREIANGARPTSTTSRHGAAGTTNRKLMTTRPEPLPGYDVAAQRPGYGMGGVPAIEEPVA